MNLQLKVPKMDYFACRDAITNAVITVDPTAIVQGDLKPKQVKIDTQVSVATIKNAIEVVGYTV